MQRTTTNRKGSKANDKHHIKEGFKRSTLICFDAVEKIYNSISEETKTVEVHQGQFATPNAMTENVYDNEWTPWSVNTILIAGNSMINGTDKRDSQRKIRMWKLDTSTEHY